MLVILDTNILLSALISRGGLPAQIYDAWHEHRFELATCHEQIEEIRRASRYPKLRAIVSPHLVGKMVNSLQRVKVVEYVPRKHVADDPNDAYLLDLVEFCEADFLVTGDKRAGLLQKSKVAGARIMTAAGFLETALR